MPPHEGRWRDSLGASNVRYGSEADIGTQPESGHSDDLGSSRHPEAGSGRVNGSDAFVSSWIDIIENADASSALQRERTQPSVIFTAFQSTSPASSRWSAP